MQKPLEALMSLNNVFDVLRESDPGFGRIDELKIMERLDIKSIELNQLHSLQHWLNVFARLASM